MSGLSDEIALKIVKDGYDKIGAAYTVERRNFGNFKELEKFSERLPVGAKILDVGCGTGIPNAEFLVGKGFQVIGIDMSDTMISLARKNVPSGEFTKMNMLEMNFQKESFDGLLSTYAVIHVPRERHEELFKSFHRVLKPGGIMLISSGPDEWEGEDQYLGVDMYWSHYDPAVYHTMLTAIGFDIDFAQNITDGNETHHWIMARKNQSSEVK